MKINPVFQENEENLCIYGHGSFDFYQVAKTWRCPVCKNLLSIKVEIKNFKHSANRIPPSELEVGELVTLDNRFIHEVLAISKSGNDFRVALKEYTAINIDPESLLTRVIGGWSD
jgi:hypothetical protein